MPGLDGTGPMGMGPMTGGGRGFCSPWGIGAALSRYGYPRGAGYRYPYYGAYGPGPFGSAMAPFAPRMTREQELELLKAESQALREGLRELEVRIKVLEGGAEA